MWHALAEAERFEVLVCNAAHVKNVPGRKTDVDPAVLAELARGRLRKKIPDLTLALDGRFSAHHGSMCRLHLDHIDHLTAAIGRVEAQVETMIVAFEVPRRRLCTVPGIAERTSASIISEIGVDMSWFPSGGHLASWIGLCPGNHESAGKRKSGKTRKGNPYLKSVFVEAAWAAVHTDSRLKARYQRLLRRFGGARNQVAVKKAIVAIAHTLCVIVWHLLHAEVDYTDLGADYYTRRDNPEIRKNQLVRQLQSSATPSNSRWPRNR